VQNIKNKSITGETPIIIIENDEGKYTEIGKWIDELLETNKEKIQHIKEENVEMLYTRNIYIASTDYKGNVSWREISAVTRHEPVNRLYDFSTPKNFEIKTSSGRKIKVTESKSILIMNEEKGELKRSIISDIKIGDYVPITIKLKDAPINQTRVEFSKYLPIKDAGKFELDYMSGILVGNFICSKGIVKCSELREFLTNFINDSIPMETFIAPKSFICGLLKGYINYRGYIEDNEIIIDISKNGGIENVEFEYNSEKLGNCISMLCSRIGVLCYIKSEKIIIPKKWVNRLLYYIDTPNFGDGTGNTSNTEIIENVKNDVFLDKIIEINIIEEKSNSKVYDLTVESTFNFSVANGIQLCDT